jgi:hypothetical protein
LPVFFAVILLFGPISPSLDLVFSRRAPRMPSLSRPCSRSLPRPSCSVG